MTESNRKLVEDFLSAIASQGVREAFERYAVEDYIQHNPHAAPGREGAIACVEAESARGGRATAKRIIAEGNLVAVHLHLAFPEGSPDLAIVDIWRIRNGKLVEHWDVQQEIPASARNSMF